MRVDDVATFIEPGRRPCIIGEGLFMYLTAEQQRTLWQGIANALKVAGGGTFAFDLVPSSENWRSGRAGQFIAWSVNRATGGASFVNDDRSRHDIAAELKDTGFETVELLEPAPLLGEWDLPFPEAQTQVLLFRCTVTA